MRKSFVVLMILVLSIFFLSSCVPVTPEPTLTPDTTEIHQFECPPVVCDEPEADELEPVGTEKTEEVSVNEPVQVTGNIEVTSAIIFEVYFFERFVMLEDLTGFIQRDFEFELDYSTPLKPPAFVARKEKDLDAYFSDVANLKPEVDQLRDEAN